MFSAHGEYAGALSRRQRQDKEVGYLCNALFKIDFPLAAANYDEEGSYLIYLGQDEFYRNVSVDLVLYAITLSVHLVY